MDLVQLFRALGRRWYAVLAGLIVLTAAAVLTFRLVPVTYDAKASLLLIPPTKTVVETNGNPFLNLGGLDVVAGVLSLSLTDTTTVARMAPPSSKATYTVSPDQSIPGSVLDIGVSARTPGQALDILNSLESLASVRLTQLQDQVNAPQASQARIMVITDNNKATPNISALSRALIVVIAAGLVLTFLLTISLDTVIRRRKDRKAARQPAHATAEEQNDGSNRTDDGAAKRSKESIPTAEKAPARDGGYVGLDDDDETDLESLVGYDGRSR